MPIQEVTEFGLALLFIVIGIVFAGVGLVAARIIAPRRPNALKDSAYECGEEAEGTAWVQFNIRFYAVGLIFLIFDVEVLLLYPWATALSEPALLSAAPAWGWLALVEALLFIGILALGLAYVWAKGDLDWVRPATKTPVIPSGPGLGTYAAYNQTQWARREPVVPQPAEDAEASAS